MGLPVLVRLAEAGCMAKLVRQFLVEQGQG
jgi:hypothetical protein